MGNVVVACRRCNHFKGSRLLQECSMELQALPKANFAEYLVLLIPDASLAIR